MLEDCDGIKVYWLSGRVVDTLYSPGTGETFVITCPDWLRNIVNISNISHKLELEILSTFLTFHTNTG